MSFSVVPVVPDFVSSEQVSEQRPTAVSLRRTVFETSEQAERFMRDHRISVQRSDDGTDRLVSVNGIPLTTCGPTFEITPSDPLIDAIVRGTVEQFNTVKNC